MSPWTRLRSLMGIFMLLMITTGSWAAQDTIVTKGGDRLVGKIRNLKRGWLTRETDYGDNDFIIDWEEIK